MGVAHGQMSRSEELERVMEELQRPVELDVLVATTIIESGIDNPHTNTLIIEDSQRLRPGADVPAQRPRGPLVDAGLRLLHVPRPTCRLDRGGRRRASPRIDEHTDLGSGMRIAMRDLEIRGAGSAHGRRAASATCRPWALTCSPRCSRQAVNATREGDLKAMDQLPPALSDITVNVPGHTYLPEDYVPDADERVLWYRKIASAATVAGGGGRGRRLGREAPRHAGRLRSNLLRARAVSRRLR